ncbi:MAG TPA: ATP-binding protein [Mucilaginibacter sp.]|jgi:signal transduction histidine kinase
MNKTQDLITKPDSQQRHEEERINALNRYRINDTLPEKMFSNYLQLATLIFKVPGVIIVFVEQEVIYKAYVGIDDVENIKQYITNCAETIRSKDDIHIASNISNSYLPPNSPNQPVAYNYYIGASIFTRDGYPIGCLGLLDRKPHKLKTEQIKVLKMLASAVMDALEERLRNLQEAEQNEWVLKTTREGICVWDVYKDKIWWNPAFGVIFGYDQIVEPRYDISFWYDRFAAESYAEVKSAMQTFSLNGEYVFKRADDTPVRVSIRSTAIKDDFGQPVKMICSILDITERVKNEETNLKANLELMRDKDEFIDVATHEIKTPISIIKSYSQIIRREAERNNYEKTNFINYAERIQKQNEKLLKLVENLLDISRINSGKMTVYPEPFDFAKLLEQILDELDIQTSSHYVEKRGDIPLIVYADKFRIGQVLTNLITNAIKYSPGADRIIIDYNKNTENNTATISIRDFGRGIAKQEQENLFQRFYRIVDADEQQVLGTGLGLSIAMEIVKQHGSTIAIDSELGQGSVFSFNLQLSNQYFS